MDNEENNQNQEEENTGPSPEQIREMLFAKARMLGVEFSNNIGTETLRERINAKIAENEKPQEEEAAKVNALEETARIAEATSTLDPSGNKQSAEKPEKPLTARQYLYNESMKLIRCRITNMDPKKKDLHGEIFTVANEYIGSVRKFVPYGEATDDGYHIPHVIYKQLVRRKFLNIRTIKDKRTGVMRPASSWQREFAIEVLDPLTEDELNRLKIAQIAAGSMDSDNNLD